MIDYLNRTRSKYHLSLGEYKFSPIMETSVALALSYRDLHLKNKQQFPFYFSFPDKNDASIWLSISLLTNFFLEDYVDQTGSAERDLLKKGDKIEIFDVVAEISSVSPGKLFLQFSDGVTIELNSKLRKQVNKTDKKHTNNYSLYKKHLKNYKKSRNPISKILEPKDDTAIINENDLSSKVLLVTGRGNAKNLRYILKTYEIYGEPLSKIFVENKNLLIKRDLESYKNAFDLTISDKENLFKQLLLTFLEKTNEIEANLKSQLRIFLESNNFLKPIFKEKLDDLNDVYCNDFPEINRIYNKYPGIKEGIPKNIKAVIINEIEQVDLYKEAVTGFLNNGVPVFVISDRYIQRSTDLNFFNNFFCQNIDALRINWNRKKINVLKDSVTESNECLDSKLWKNCLQYSKQKITITVSESNPLDKLLYESQKIIKNLDEFELIQESYYKYLYPAVYLFKNSTNKHKIVDELVEYFNDVLQKNKICLEKSIHTLLQETVDSLKNTTKNSKYIRETSNIFSNTMPLNLKQNIFIPSNRFKINIPDGETEKITFSGYPFNEFSGRYLIDSVCYHYVPEIEIICWPIEADLTYNYLKRRILAGYFADNLYPDWEISNELVLKNTEQFLAEVDTFFLCNKPNGVELKRVLLTQENDVQAVYKLKYKEYEKAVAENQSYRVKCNILNFSDGSFLFLPKNSKVLTQIETDDGSLKFRNSSFSELEIGLSIFRYKKDRKDLRELAKNNSVIKKAFTELELWKTLLHKLYTDNHSEIDRVEKILLSTKSEKYFIGGNPVKYNIQRWLFDEELIAPEIENIRIILAASEYKEIDKTLGLIGSAKSKVEGYTISLSAQIKKSIGKKIEKEYSSGEKEFKLYVDNVQIHVESRVISSLEKSEIEIEYQNTNKLLF
jgi:hypothetical protein